MKRVYGNKQGKDVTTEIRRPLRIGLTGGIGCGKSTVAKLFMGLQVPVIDTDTLARELVAPGQPALQQIAARFGRGVLCEDGTLDRAKLRAQVFSDRQARHDLERILHPLIRAKMREKLRQMDAAYCILEIPLLLESGWEDEVDRILVVDTPPELQMERILQRGRLTREEAEQIIATQRDREQRLAAADDIITNEGDIHHLEEQVKQLHNRYQEMAR